MATKQTNWIAAAEVMAPYLAAKSWKLPEAPPPAPTPLPQPPGATPAPKPKSSLLEKSIKAATIDYLRAHEKAQSAASTMRQKNYLMRDIEEFSQAHDLICVEDWTTELVREFGETWKVSLSTHQKLLGNVKAFFEFCLSNQWVTRNPARYKVIKNRATQEKSGNRQALAFSDLEVTKMFEACHEYGKKELRIWPKKKGGKQIEAISEWRDYNRRYTGEDLMDFIALSAWTGLRISDVVLFHIERLSPNGMCKVRAMKNGAWVSTKLPDWLANRIRDRAKKFGPVVFGPHESNRIDTLTNKWRNHLKEVWEQCGPWPITPKPHRFRHTFIRILLQNGVPVERIAELVGDTPETIRKYYSGWVQERQDSLTEILESAFASVPNPFAPHKATVLELKHG